MDPGPPPDHSNGLAARRNTMTASPHSSAAHGSADLLKQGPHERIRSIDGLRGLAVLTVMLLHFNLMRPSNMVETGLVQLLGIGWIGVDLFFLVSGFLITGILWESRGTDGYFWRFYTRRTLRIFPLYYAFLFALLIVLPALFSQYAAEHVGNDKRIWLWTYLSNILMAREGWEGLPSHTTHLWSLAIEEQFYLIWPLVVYLLGYRGLVATCLVILGASPLIRAALDHAAPNGIAAYTLLPARLDGLALGALIALVLRTNISVREVRRGGVWLSIAGVGGLVALSIFGALHGVTSLLPALDYDVQVIGYSLIALAFGGLLLLTLTSPEHSRLQRLLATPFLQSLGKYSYALYLFHVPLRNLVRERIRDVGGLPKLWGSELPAQIVLFVAAIGITWCAAVISWHLFEKHWLNLKDRVPYGRPREAEVNGAS